MTVQREQTSYTQRSRKRKLWQRIVSGLTCFVVFCTTYAMILPALTLEADSLCGIQEHTHASECYAMPDIAEVKELICTIEEQSLVQTSEAYDAENDPGCNYVPHVHEDGCYLIHLVEPELICQEAEHTHDLVCYVDETADLQTPADWEGTIAALGEKTLLAVAKSQLGNRESKKNYIVLEDGVTTKGYNRYGVWANDPYADWNDLFIDFCFHYAGLKPFEGRAEKGWLKAAKQADRFLTSDAVPLPGDLIFLEKSGAAVVGIVNSVTGDGIVSAIVGDWQDAVSKESWSLEDPAILGYAAMTERTAAPQTEETTAATTAPETTVETTFETTAETTAETIAETTAETVPETTAETVAETTPETQPTVPLILSASMTVEIGIPEEAPEAKLPSENMAVTPGNGEDTPEETAASVSAFSPFAMRRTAYVPLKTDTSTREGIPSGTDLRDKITSITVSHKTTAWGDTWKELKEGEVVQRDELLRFAISYRLPGGTLSQDNNTVYYQLPVTKIDKAESGNVYSNTGSQVGTYAISTEGLITITFIEDYAVQNGNGAFIDGVVNFDSSAEALDTDDDYKIKLEFSDSASTEVEIEKKVQEDLTVTKSAQVQDEENGLVLYTVTVTSLNGTAEEVTISDKTSNMTYYSDLTVTRTSGGTTTPVEVTAPEAGTTTMNLILPKMEAGDIYTITYIGKIPSVANGTNIAYNWVTVTSKNSDGATLTGKASCEVRYNYVMIEKTGTLQSDGTVLWTILVGREGESLNGWTLSDKLNGLPLQIPVTLIFPDSTTLQTTLPYTFGDVNGVVKVTYTTDLDYSLGYGSMANTATLTPPEGTDKPSYSDTENVTAPGDNAGESYNPMEKDSDFLTPNEGKTEAQIGWRLTVNADKGAIYTDIRYDADGNAANYGWCIHDGLQNGQYFTDAQWTALEQEVQTELFNTFQTESDSLYTLEKVITNGKLMGFRLTVYETLPKGVSFTLDYTSTVSLGDGSQVLHFQNTVSMNDKIWQNGYADYYPVVSKMDASNNSTGTTTHPLMDLVNRTVGWKIQLYLPETLRSKVTVIEDLPDQLELSSLMLTMPDNANVSFSFDGNSAQAQAGGYTLSAELKTEDGNKVLYISLPEEFVNAYAQQKLILTVNTRIPDDFVFPDNPSGNIDTAELTNIVTITSGDENEYVGSDEHTQKITNEDTTKQVTKSIGNITDNVVPYSVTINPNGSNLDPDSDYLTVEDELSFTNYSATDVFGANLIDGTVKVYEIDANGNILADLSAGITYTYNQETKDWGNNQIEVNHRLELQVPDSRRIRLDYSYKITGNVGSGTTFSNTAKLRNVQSEGETNHRQWIKVQESNAEANLYSVNIYKVDADNYAIHLPGARFQLYKYVLDETTGTGQWQLDQEVVSNGESALGIKEIEVNQAYYLVETQAPEGYLLDQTPHYFLIYDSAAKDSSGKVNLIKPDDFPTGAYVAKSGSIYIENEAVTSVCVQKKWVDSSGNATEEPSGVESIEFKLFQVYTPASGTTITTQYGPYTIYRSKGWQWNSTDTEEFKYGIPFADGNGGTYAYYVEEVDEGYAVTYSNGSANTALSQAGVITISNVNPWTEMDYELPKTGGPGTMLYTLGGVLLCGSSLAVCRKKRKEEDPS